MTDNNVQSACFCFASPAANRTGVLMLNGNVAGTTYLGKPASPAFTLNIGIPRKNYRDNRHKSHSTKTKFLTLDWLTFGSGPPIEQWTDRRWIGTAPADRFGPFLDRIRSAVVSVAAAVVYHKRISSSSPKLTRTTTTCQVSRNRHHPPAPADRRTRAPPSPRLSPRRRRRQRAGQSGLAPWPTIRFTGPIIHPCPRRVSS